VDGVMLKRVLVANRGEIAVRVIRACRELGVETVAVYSDADARAPHALAADRAVRIGPPAPRESYLNQAAILDAAWSSGADAIHPGYGFLSERAAFARACEDRGIVFIGPPSSAIERMGSKVGARKLMQDAGVPVVPGETPPDQQDASLVAAATRIGFPVLIKPSAGGGGIGMKVVRERTAMLETLAQARREAQAAFGDATLYVERLVDRPRHIEVQILADAHEGTVHLFERECSMQRRHQKVIEESPSPAVSSAIREQIGGAAVAAARAAGYRNAGTVEFLLDGEGDDARFYFLEMNTRLQVEHPVTEMVTGVDLVQAQLRVAAGEPLPWAQASLSQRGHAIECRVYAEDPRQNFLPQAGPLPLYREPQGPGIRVDSGVAEGGEITVHYDPMIAKVIVAGDTRETARQRAVSALRRYTVLGVRTNIAFLIALLEHPAFVEGRVDTGLLDREGDALRTAIDADLPLAAFAAAAVHQMGAVSATSIATPAARRELVPADPFVSLGAWRIR
jgi:acetyl-CoA carboxylase biotin carboxylase subunit